MLNPVSGTLNAGAPIAHVHEEMIPSEGSSIHQDDRLYDRNHISPGSRISLQSPVLSQNIAGRGVREGINRPLGAPVQSTDYTQSYEAVPAGIIDGSQYQMDQTAGLSRRDARIVEKHLPDGIEATNIAQGTIPGQVIGGTETVYYTTGTEQYVQPEVTGIPSNITQSVYYQGQTFTNPQIMVSGPIGMETVERRFAETTLSEIPVAEPPQHMRDSANLGRVSASPTQRSRWEIQQADVSAMRYENHQTFENWEVNRNIFVTDRLNIMDDLLAGMERKLAWVETGVQKVIQFFKERQSQEEMYSKKLRHNLPQLGEHFEAVSQPDAFYDFSRGMKESDAFHARETRNSEILAMFIKKDILDWILIPSEKNYRLQSQALRGPLYNHRKRVDHFAHKRSRAYQKYFKLYDQLQKNPMPSKKENKIFSKQLKYSLSAREELRMLKLYCEQGLIVINEFTTLCTNRLQEIQKAFSIYLQKYSELNQNTVTPPEPILDMIERANSIDGMIAIFQPAGLMSVANYDFLRNKLTRPEITYLDLQQYLVYFPESVDPARSSFVLAEWEAVKEGTMLHRPRACTVIATTQSNLLIVEKKLDSEIGTVKNPLQLRFTRVEGVEPGIDGLGTTVNVVERTPGTLFTHKHKAKLRFETQESAAQFLQYVNNQIAQAGGEVVNPQMSQISQTQVGQIGQIDQIGQMSQVGQIGQISQVGQIGQIDQFGQASQYSGVNQLGVNPVYQMSQISPVTVSQVSQTGPVYQQNVQYVGEM